jgi:hypothetical protein
VDAHQRFIDSTRRGQMPASRTPTVPQLQKLYEGWAKQHPQRAAYRGGSKKTRPTSNFAPL